MTFFQSGDCYNRNYPGSHAMIWHDGATELERWFNNWRIDRYASYAYDSEWLTIDESFCYTRKNRIVCYIGTIGSDYHSRTRIVRFEPGAPPPPSFLRPIMRKYEPPSLPKYRPMPFEDYDYCYYMSSQEQFIANLLPPVSPPPPRFRRN